MPVIATLSESNSAATSVASGTINSGPLAGLTVTGLSFAGRSASGVGATLTGIFGSLTIQANGAYSYTLNNTDRDTDLLATGDQATERFVVTYSLGGTSYTFDLNIAINGLDETGQVNTVTGQTVYLTGPTTLAAGTYLRSSAAVGMDYTWQEEGDIDLTIDGSVTVRRTAHGGIFDSAAGINAESFVNNGRLSVYLDGTTGDYYPGASGLRGIGTNNGVISVINAVTIAQGTFSQRGIGWEGNGTNNGLIEVISTHEAFGIWARGNITNTGTIYVQGGPNGDPLGTIGIRDGGNLLNTGSIHVVSTDPAHQSVAYYQFPGSTNIYNNVLRIDNQGAIVADIAFYIAGGYSVSTNLTNSGRIEGDLVIDSGVNVIENLATGSWIGDLDLGPQNDIVSNAGSITGNVDLGARGDLFIARGTGSLSGTVHGGADNDVLIGAQAADRLAGDDGNDWIEGGGGADTLTGGTGADTFAYRLASDSTAAARDTITDFVSGSDRIDISALGATSFSLTPSGVQTILSATNAAGTLSVAITGTIVAGDVINSVPTATVSGTSGNDALAALVVASTLNGQDGDDTHYGSSGSDVLDGGSGGDSMFGGGGDDIYYVDSGQDRIAEERDSGIDEIRTTVSYSLQINLENATLLGSSTIGILGNARDNVLTGNDAQNVIRSGGGHDTIIGGLGGDYIQPGAARLVYRSVAESTTGSWDMIDQFEHGATVIDLTALDVLSVTIEDHLTSYMFYDGPHMDFAAYIYGWVNVSINTSAGMMFMVVSGRIDLSDFLLASAPGSIIPLSGSTTNDFLGGREGADELRGLAGDDTLEGKGGTDLIDGGDGIDIASYAGATSGVTVNLGLSGQQDTLGAGLDTLISIEGLRGSAHDDTLIGNSAANSFDSGTGNDSMYGGAGSDTAFFAGNRADYSVYTEIIGGLLYTRVVGLGAFAGQGTDSLTMVEFAQFADQKIQLTTNPNNRPVLGQPAMVDQTVLDGQAYSYQIPATSFIELDAGDVLTFRATLADGSPLPGWLSFNSATRTFSGTPPVEAIGAVLTVRVFATDNSPFDPGYEISDEFVLTINQAPGATVYGTDGNDQLVGTFRNESLLGFEGDDLLTGSAGDDVMNGGVGIADMVDYSSASGPITVNLDAGNASGGDIGSDLLTQIEGAIGSVYNDSLTGSIGNDFLYGNLGDDTFHGLDGSDQLFGEAGSDTLYGEGAVDLLSGGGGADFLYGGGGNDALWSANPSLPLFPNQMPYYWVDPLFDRGNEADLLDGGDGDDSLFAGYGDTVTGGANDSFGDTLYISFMGASAGVTADFNQASLTIGGGTISGIENTAAIEGSDFDDDLTSRTVVPGFNGYTTLAGMGGNDRLVANARTTVMDGGDGNDTLDSRGSLTLQTVSGGAGHDRLIFNAAASGGNADGGTGIDTLVIDNADTASFTGLSGFEALHLVNSQFTISSTEFANAFAFNSDVSGTGRLIVGIGPSGTFIASQMSFASTIALTVNGSESGDVVKGPAGAAMLVSGEGGADQIRTGNLADSIQGGDGNDKIMAMGGADILLGGAGADQFRYLFANDSGLGAGADQILDFTNGSDKLDFRLLDADPNTAGRQALSFIGNAVFATDGSAQVRYVDDGADTRVELDLNGDGAADMHILLFGHAGQTLAGSDFML